MAKYLITWDAGCGENQDEVEATTQEEAQDIAYEAWKQEAESQAEYDAKPMTAELADEYGFNFEEEE